MPIGDPKTGARAIPRVLLAIAAAVVVVASAGYWWLNRPPERYKPDNGGLYPINVNGKYGFMDRSGKTVITPQFDMAFGFSEGLAQVRVGNKSGYIDAKGLVVISPQFDAAMEFQYGRAMVKLCCSGEFWELKPGTRYGVIDRDGKYISNPDFSWVGMGFSGDLAPVSTADGHSAFVDRSGRILFSGKVEGLLIIGFTSGLAPATSGLKWGFIDRAGKWVIDPQFEMARNFADGLAPVKVGGKVGYVDKRGKFVINPQYDFGGEFYDGFAYFSSGGKLGFIDTKGRAAVAAQFLSAGNFSDGLAPVKTEDGWGFIDPTGKMVISPLFDDADNFHNGLARVTVGGKEAYVTTAGKFVVDPFPGTTPRAEKARLAAEVAEVAAKNRLRVAQGIIGAWVGTVAPHVNDQVTITNDGSVLGAVLLNIGWREVFHAEILEDNKLVLTGTNVTRASSAASGTYSLDTFRLELSADGTSLTGQYRDAVGHGGPVELKKSPRGAQSSAKVSAVDRSRVEAGIAPERVVTGVAHPNVQVPNATGAAAVGVGNGGRSGPGPDGAFRISDGVSQPDVLFKQEPEYSAEARTAKLQGKVMLAIVVDTDGKAKNIRVVRSLGMGLDEKAIEAIGKWRFQPGQKDGHPVPVMANIEVNFKLL